MKLTVLLDVDGILTNYAAQTVELLNELKLGKTFTEADITDWEASHYVPRARQDEYWKRCNAPGFVLQMKPYLEAQQAVETLHRLAEVVVVTSYLRGATTWVHERDQWLLQHFGIKPDHVIHTRAKQHVFGHVFVDDALKNVVPWGRKHGGSTALLWDKPYNQDATFEDEDHFERVWSWGAVLETVSAMRDAT